MARSLLARSAYCSWWVTNTTSLFLRRPQITLCEKRQLIAHSAEHHCHDTATDETNQHISSLAPPHLGFSMELQKAWERSRLGAKGLIGTCYKVDPMAEVYSHDQYLISCMKLATSPGFPQRISTISCTHGKSRDEAGMSTNSVLAKQWRVAWYCTMGIAIL